MIKFTPFRFFRSLYRHGAGAERRLSARPPTSKPPCSSDAFVRQLDGSAKRDHFFRREIADRRWLLRATYWLLLGVGMVMTLWLTLRRSSEVPAVAWLPEPLLAWVNTHGRLRNLPAYLLLSIPALLLSPAHRRGYAAAAVGGFAAVMELVQLGVSSRHFDGWDIVLSWLGVLMGYTYCACVRTMGFDTGKPNCNP